MKLKITSGLDGLYSISNDWKEISEKFPQNSNLYNCYERYVAYLKYLRVNVDATLYFYCIYDEENCLAIFPLEIKNGTLQFPYNDHLVIYDIVAKSYDESLIDILLTLLRANRIKWNKINFCYFSEASNLYKHLLLTKNLKTIRFEVGKSAYLENGENGFSAAKDSLKSLKKSLRSDYNRMAKRGHYELLIVDHNNESAEFAFNTFLNIESSGWKGREGSAIACQQNLINFYKELFFTLNAKIFLLKLNEDYISTQFSIEIGSTVYLVKPGYDENFKNLSPGILVQDLMKRYYADRLDIKILDGIGDSFLKIGVTRQASNVYILMLFNNKRVKGLLNYCYYAYGKRPLRKAYHICKYYWKLLKQNLK